MNANQETKPMEDSRLTLETYTSVANQQASVVIALLKEYGFTPASRGRLPARLYDDPDWTGLAKFEMK